ncbi:MAG: terminase small subunit [Candidatus Accumulibacter sp.]|uniref:terminase small subunit n=1 Tax=Accumulibacter sp. TaxID=2053492 RepID=UPI002589E615|nr:terminase small subunit [Accumulibacter sp.]MBK8113477.1 terminase small subunit [Accumulibacter sp.]
MNKLQSAFVDEYLIDLNATQAAIRAGYSAKTAGAIGHKLLKVAEIQSSIAERSKARSERTEITQDLVLTDIELIKRDAMREALDKEGNKAMINHTAALKACELQGRHLQMWNDKLALMNKDGSPLLQNLTVNLVRANGSD